MDPLLQRVRAYRLRNRLLNRTVRPRASSDDNINVHIDDYIEDTNIYEDPVQPGDIIIEQYSDNPTALVHSIKRRYLLRNPRASKPSTFSSSEDPIHIE